MRLRQLQLPRAAGERGREQPRQRVLRHLRQSHFERSARFLDLTQRDEGAGAIEMGFAFFHAVGQAARQCRVETGARLGGIARRQRGITGLRP